MRSVRSGFTFVELTVVAATIIIFMTLMLPGLTRMREAARRVHCRNNLCQIAVALHNYHDAHRVLPPGCVNETGPVTLGVVTDNHFGWIVQILPQLDEGNCWEQFDFTRTSYQQAPTTVKSPAILHCPSSPMQMLSYAGCHHDAPGPIDVDNNGVLFLNSSIRLQDITDGKAYTLMVGETLPPVLGGTWYQGGAAALRHSGTSWDSIDDSAMRAYYHSASIKDELDPKSPEAQIVSGFPLNFGSVHSDGTHFALADGTVRFVPLHANVSLLRRLGNRHDGEVIEEFEFP